MYIILCVGYKSIDICDITARSCEQQPNPATSDLNIRLAKSQLNSTAAGLLSNKANKCFIAHIHNHLHPRHLARNSVSTNLDYAFYDSIASFTSDSIASFEHEALVTWSDFHAAILPRRVIAISLGRQ